MYNYSTLFFNLWKVESFSDYQECRSKGFTKEFFVINPHFPNQCLCKDGEIGKILPGFKRKCICDGNLYY